MRQYGPGNPLILSHIPKTAGTSLHAALRTALQPAVDVSGYDSSLFGYYDDMTSVSEQTRNRVFATPEDLPADAGLVAGHISPHTTMTRYPGADHTTVLRLPQVRVLSQWMHSRALTEFDLRHWGRPAEAFRAAWGSLRDYVANPLIAPNVDNTITRFLVWPHPLAPKVEFIDEKDDDELLAAALARLDQFAHVNVVENKGFLDDLSNWLGAPLPRAQLNERTGIPQRRRPDLEAELAGPGGELLEHRCRIDSRIWQHVLAGVSPDADPTAVRDDSIARSVRRYQEMPRQPLTERPVRRVVARAYDAAARFRR